MNELIVTLGLTGAAAWSAKKLLGPALDAMGGDIASFYKDFRIRNLRSIFGKAEPLLKQREEKEHIESVSPRLLSYIVERASLEDDDYVQDLWAGILSTATSDNESDTLILTNALSQMTKREADLFNSFCRWSKFDFKTEITEDVFGDLQNTYIDNLNSVPLPIDGTNQAWQSVLTEKLWHFNFWWPARIISASLPTKYGDTFSRPIYTAKHYNVNRKGYDVLEMIGLVKAVTTFGTVSGLEATLVSLEITRIGVELRRRTLHVEARA